ncbi:MAG: L-sorbosone dehydrogenase [Devosia sp.]|uniref:glucose/sorbosone family PQQ-dependent dehydrogenase n=1 Tax=Devosia sp. TaxID=1871048 RepID=UPI002608152B|nr:glucose/sorbosone family PQQ-dependent dehydrogenase [Devosia sp.]MDB5588999.1 L-sorbosone dehydrogenase [Devosia sp.]
MKRHVALAVALLAMAAPALAQDTPDAVVAGTVPFEMKVLTTGLEGPWELTWGPDDYLWVTERTAGRIDRINPADGSKTTLIDIGEVSAPGGQDGLLGLALHPDLLKGSGNDYVYTAYTYVDEARGADPVVTDPASPYRFLYTKIVRLTYDAAAGKLIDPVDLIVGLPASSDHNSGRMKIGPDGKLYYTIGDGGKDQLGNWCQPIEAQRLPTTGELEAEDYIAYQGKSLRLNLDGTIPDDNPRIGNVVSHIFTYGHRNMQGIDFAPDGTLYASEQGPKTDDEVNILVPGGNFGWPHVAGFRDDKAYQYARWKDATTPCEQLQFSDIIIDPSVPVEDETSWTEPMQDPLATLFTVPSEWDFTDPVCKGVDFICWPTVAASSIQTYMPTSEAIPGWENSLIVTTLKRGSIYRLPLAADGKSLRGPIERYFQSENRFRDVALSPDSKAIYVATDPGGLAEALAGGTTTTMQNPGSILVFSYTGNSASTTAPTSEALIVVPGETNAATGLPPSFTAAQADRGKIAYNANCVSCHGQNLISATYGTPLAGEYFAGNWNGKPVGDLYRKAHDTMPPSRPGALPATDYADIIAYVLSVNGLAAGDAELPADPATLDGMTITAGASQ